MSKRVTITPDAAMVPGALLLALALLTCGPAQESAPESDSSVNAAEPVASDTAPSPAAGSGRDISTLDLCALLPVADVAAVLDRDPGSGTAEATVKQWVTDCTYSFKRNDSNDYFMVWAYSPEFWAPEVDTEAEKISGLGHAAYVTSTGSLAKIMVLIEGDVFFDTRAATPEEARRLAELAIERLAPTEADR